MEAAEFGVRQTSLAAFYRISDEKLGRRQKEVYDAIKNAEGPICDHEIARILGRPINTLTARRNELVKKGLVRKAYREKYPKEGSDGSGAIHGEVW